MNKNSQLMFKISSILMAVFGVLGTAISAYIVFQVTGGFRHNNWLDTGSAASSAIICAFSCVVCACGGIYGIFAKERETKTSGFNALALISFVYYLASCLLSAGDNRVMILSFLGIVLSIYYVIAAVIMKNNASHEEAAE